MKAADLLAKVSIFSHLNEEDLQRIAKKSRYCQFNIGDVIIKEGERDGRLYVLISGKVEVIKGFGLRKEKRLRTLAAPCYFGEMALINNLVRSATVVARGNTKTLCLDQWNLHQEIEKYPKLAIELLQVMNRRFLALEIALVNAIGGFIPICSNCKMIHAENGSWMPIEKYIMEHTEHEFSHGICPQCRKKLYPESTRHLI